MGVLATFGYDDLGRRTSLTRGNGTVTSYAHDAASRLSQLTQDMAGTGHDLTLGFGYNPAGQIVANTRSNDLYAWTGHSYGTTASAANGLNQLTQLGANAITYDARGNLTHDGEQQFVYTSENRLSHATSAYMAYDPVGRLYYFGNSGTVHDYAGSELIFELDGSGTQINRRYVHGPGVDEPLVWYEGSGTSDRRFLHADERGSIVAVSDSTGTVINVNRYDEYGVPASTNVGRFQYTGQQWIPELKLYYYKARFYSPRNGGRFMQTDPIGYGDGMNRYTGMGGDPVNFTDPSGLTSGRCTGTRICGAHDSGGSSQLFGNTGSFGSGRDASIPTVNKATNTGGTGERKPWAGELVKGGAGEWGGMKYWFGDDQTACVGLLRRVCQGFINEVRRFTSGRSISFDSVQLQRNFKHAGDFGVSGNWNPKNGFKFMESVREHVGSSGTTKIIGSYRGNPVHHYLDPMTRLNVITSRFGHFISGWRLNAAQLLNLTTRGSL